MQHPLDTLAEFMSAWPWVWILLTVLTMLMSVAVIAFTTRHSIRSQTVAINKIMADTAAAPSETSMVTVGRGSVRWLRGGYTMTMVRRFPAAAEHEIEAMADNAVAEFSQRLASVGIDPEDVAEAEAALAPNGVATLGVSVVLRDPSMEKEVTRAALAAGFTEESAGTRAEITDDDAHEASGRRAVADAIDNSRTLASGLSLARHTLEIVSAELETLQAPGEGDAVVKRATIRWRYVPAGETA